MTLESIIYKINLEGFRVLNLFQRKDGSWQANLCNDEKCWEFGVAGSPKVALQIAFESVNNTPGFKLSHGLKHYTTESLLDSL